MLFLNSFNCPPGNQATPVKKKEILLKIRLDVCVVLF